MNDEIALSGGTHGPIVRAGETVRRAARPQTPAVQALLRHLERAGFDGAPRALGVDEQGREVLSYLPGEVVGQRGAGVPPRYVRSDETLAGVARLLRRFHDAAAGFVPPADAAWAFQVGAPRVGDTICHNDIGPWNTVFRNGVPVAFIDWDTAAPAPRIWDVAYTAYRFVPFVPDAICALAGWETPPDRAARLRLFCAAYGDVQPADVLATMERRIAVIAATGLALGEAGDPLYGERWREIVLPRLERDIAFVQGLRGSSSMVLPPASG